MDRFKWILKQKKLQIRCVLYIFVILSPLFAGLIISIISGTSIFTMDEWHSTWNDEVGFFKSVITMREMGMPSGVRGYNEVRPAYPAYGAYNYLTYVPYLLISFLTGIKSHNFMVYANVLLLVFALAALVFIIHPTIKQCIWIFLLVTSHLITVRYVWSGMSETSTIALMIVVLACQFRMELLEVGKSFWVLQAFQIILIIFCGLIRPFLLIYLILPLTVFVSKRNLNKMAIFYIFFILGIGGIAIKAYFWMAANFSSPYFEASRLAGVRELLSRGEWKQTIKQLIIYNIEALDTIKNNFFAAAWSGIMPIELFFLCLVLLIIGGCYLYKKNKAEATDTVIILALLIGVYEANVALYSPNQLHRMLLSSVISIGIFIILKYADIPSFAHEIIIIVLMFVCISIGGNKAFALPQQSKTEQYDEKELNESFKEAVPYSSTNEWENTVASIPQSENLYLIFCMPSYIGFNTCQWDYLSTAIQEGTLNSRYVWVRDDNEELNLLCETHNFEEVWKDYGYTMYKRTGDAKEK